jgi:hypothetical protein
MFTRLFASIKYKPVTFPADNGTANFVGSYRFYDSRHNSEPSEGQIILNSLHCRDKHHLQWHP